MLQKYYKIITKLLTFFVKYNKVRSNKKAVKLEELILAIGDIIVGIDIGS